MQHNTQSLVDAIMLDMLPGLAVMVDFGLDQSERAFGALQWALKHDMCTVEELDGALGNGPKLTEIANRGHNPYFCTITTAWDDIPAEEDCEDEEEEGCQEV